jgi:hypothetical protein
MSWQVGVVRQPPKLASRPEGGSIRKAGKLPPLLFFFFLNSILNICTDTHTYIYYKIYKVYTVVAFQ